MKKIALSIVAIASAVVASTDTNSQANQESGFFDRIHAKGDMRLRYETIEKGEGVSASNKYRTRYRFRYNLNVDITDNILLETATSSGRYNPTSGNVSFKDDDNWADYFVDELKVDIADIKYSFGDSWIRAGKSAHHIYRPIKTQLIWDNDIRLEGLNYGYSDGSHAIRVGANRVHRESGDDRSYKDGDDINIFLAQYVNTQKIGDAKANVGAGYYYYDGVKGNTVQSDNGFKQNSNDGTLYTEDYGILELFGEYQNKDLVMGMGFKAALTLAYNTLADDDNLGYDISAELKATKKLKLAATYRDIDKDAVYGAHNDSDFSGGGTDSSGYYVKGKYAFADNVDLGAWANWSELTDAKTDYHRVQLDVILKF
jgi:hypothetical protein